MIFLEKQEQAVGMFIMNAIINYQNLEKDGEYQAEQIHGHNFIC